MRRSICGVAVDTYTFGLSYYGILGKNFLRTLKTVVRGNLSPISDFAVATTIALSEIHDDTVISERI